MIIIIETNKNIERIECKSYEIDSKFLILKNIKHTDLTEQTAKEKQFKISNIKSIEII